MSRVTPEISFFIFGINVAYGAFARIITTIVENVPDLLMLLLITGYVILFVSVLQKFGENSLKRGAIMGLISALGVISGWILVSLILL